MTPTPTPPERTSFWKSTAGLLTALATFIAAVGTLIGALAAAGVLHPSSSTSSSPTSSSPTSSSPTSSSPPPRVDFVSIDLVYLGDRLGCTLNLIVQVGKQSAQPFGNRYTMHDVETGTQNYEIRGAITCPTVGRCDAHGSGSVDVAEGRSYNITWLNTSLGSCDVTLQ